MTPAISAYTAPTSPTAKVLRTTDCRGFAPRATQIGTGTVPCLCARLGKPCMFSLQSRSFGDFVGNDRCTLFAIGQAGPWQPANKAARRLTDRGRCVVRRVPAIVPRGPASPPPPSALGAMPSRISHWHHRSRFDLAGARSSDFGKSAWGLGCVKTEKAKRRLESSSPISAISRPKCSNSVRSALFREIRSSDRSAGCVFTQPGSNLAVPLTSGGGLLSGVKLKKRDQELTLGSKVELLQESGHTPGRHRTAGCKPQPELP